MRILPAGIQPDDCAIWSHPAIHQDLGGAARHAGDHVEATVAIQVSQRTTAHRPVRKLLSLPGEAQVALGVEAVIKVDQQGAIGLSGTLGGRAGNHVETAIAVQVTENQARAVGQFGRQPVGVRGKWDAFRGMHGRCTEQEGQRGDGNRKPPHSSV